MVDFDISPEELPIFLAETDENLQSLDEILVILEKNHEDEENLQTAFRAAHTLKGMAGMINHERMVAVTHAMETIFDGLRKKSLNISTRVIDTCLETVDALRQLREEVETSVPSDVDVNILVSNFNELFHQERATLLADHMEMYPETPVRKEETISAVVESTPVKKETDELLEINGGSSPILVEISPKSVASAARAFQVIMTLEEIGQITFLEPSREVIDSALPVHRLMASLITDATPAEIRRKIMKISEVERLFIGKEEISHNGISEKAISSAAEEKPMDGYEMLGDHLVKRMILTRKQLQNILLDQKNSKEKKLLGKLLVEKGLLSQSQLDEEITRMIQDQKTAANPNQAGSAPRKNNVPEMTVRTSVAHLNALLNMVGELITDRNHLNQLRARLERESNQHQDIEELSQTVAHLGRITDQLQEEVLSIRMLPVSNVFNKFPRLVRDISRKMNKKIELVIHGEDTELDRSIIEEINDPIIHMIRNSIDHGIESPEERKAANKPEVGTIILSARHEQGHIIITVEDDGQGIDAQALKKSAVNKGVITQDDADQMSDEEAINLIFASGLSTSKVVTDISGRGVGMDIVRNNIQHINGNISIETKPGIGTIFQVSLPLTLAIIPTMLVDSSGTTFAFPLVMVASILRLDTKDVQYIRGKPVTLLRDTVLPLISLNEVFGFDEGSKKNVDWNYVVVVYYGKFKAGIVVDRLLGQEEVVVKSLGSLIGDLPGISSAAILGDGHVSLIIDVPGLLKLSGIH